MIAVQVILDFSCCLCRGYVGVTLRCEGPGLATDNPVAAAVIACPHCGTDNDIAFSSDGVVLRVRHVPARFRMPKSV